MQNWNRFPRVFLALSLLIVLCAGLFAPRVEVAEAKPNNIPATNVVISEFRFRGDGGANDEFIELYNPTNTSIDISGWQILGSNATGPTGSRTTIPSSTVLQAGQYYLIANTGYSGPTGSNLTYGTGISDDGGVALTLSDGITIIDQVGITSCVGCYFETASLPSLGNTAASNIDRGYERKLGSALDSCQDDGDNSIDFQLINPSNPQNSSTPRRLCGIDADLRLTQSVDIASPAVGSNVEFTITVFNDGITDATNVTVRDVLPAGLSYFSDDSGGSYIGGIWTVGTLAAGTNTTIKIIATVTVGGAKTNWAEVWTSDQFDSNSVPGNNSTTENDDESVTITPPGPTPVLTITNVVNNPTPSVGANVVFTITVSNPSTNPFPATAVNVAAALPTASGLSYVSSSPSAGTTYNSTTGNWSVGNLAIGASATLIVTAQVDSSGAKNYTATASSAEYAPNAATATVTPAAITQADLSLSQTWNRSTNSIGLAELQITITNQSGIAATGVQVKDLLPSGLTYISHTSGLTYNRSTGIWAVGKLNGNASATLTINVRPSASGTSTVSFAEIWKSDQFDPDSTPGNGGSNAPPEDDYYSVDVKVADLSLTQTVDIAGSNAVFTLVVTNTGPDDASNVAIKNSKLAATSSYIYLSDNAASSGTSYNIGNGVWTIGSLASDASVSLIVTTTIVAIDENLAEVTTSVIQVDPDSLPGNSSRTEDDDAGAPSTDLSLTQVITNPSPYQNSDLNSNVTFRLTVSNAGYANATGVEVKDLLPSGLTYVSHNAPTGTTYNKNTGIWTVGSLKRNTNSSLVITAKVTLYGIRKNPAEIWSSNQSDPDSIPRDGSITDDDYASVTITSYRSVIINEVAWSGTAASAEDEWLELYNLSSGEIIITGWKIRKKSCGASGTDYITLIGKISGGGYFLLERGTTASDNTTVIDIAANQIYLASSTPRLLDTGETLYLCDNFGIYIDSANQEGFGNSINFWPKGGGVPNHPSMERISNAAETDASWGTNNGVTKNGKNANGGLIYGTPGRKNSTGSTSVNPTAVPVPTLTPAPVIIPPDPRPIINEILARPGFDWNKDGKVDVFDEFVEIKNLTSIDISLKGWKLDDELNFGSDPFTLPDVTLKPGQRVVFFALETNILLSDGGDTVRLISPNGKIYDAYTYSIAKVEDQSICRLPDGNVFGNWFEDCIPTPNLTNTREGAAPTIPDVNYESPVCKLPDTLPADFLFAECHGYGANIWDADFWDQPKISAARYIPQNTSKWESIIE